MSDWDPELYNRFRAYRSEPFQWILERLELSPHESIVDLGCGSGEHTVELASRSHHGEAVGIDSSPAMIERAERLRTGLSEDLRARVGFVLGDIRDFAPDRQYSLIFSNAALHWVSGHRNVFAACFRALVPGGRLVVQMPANEEETAQVAIRQVADEEPWRSRLSGVASPSLTVEEPEQYRVMLAEIGFCEVDAYYHVFRHPMASPAEVIEWSRSTALKPFLDRLPAGSHSGFLAQLEARLRTAYGTNGALVFNFRRLFIWARKPLV